MAQVRKMNNGGSVQKFKYGSIIKNDTKYEMDEETMKRLEQHIAAADPDIQQSLADDWNLLRSGQDVTIDTFSNQRSTKPSDFSEGQMRRLGKDKPTESRWHGRFNTDIHKYNKATQYLGTFDPSKVEVKEETPKTKLGPGSSKFEYVTNDGTKSYKSLPNTDEMKLFDDIAAYLAGDEAYRSNYDVSGWAGFNNLDTWYKGLNNSNFLRDLRIKILNGQELSTDEIDYLNTIGLGFDVASNKKVEEKKANAELKAAQDKVWADFNVGNLWSSDLRDNQFYYDSDSNTYKLNSEFMPLSLPKETRGFYFNEDFVKNNPGYEWLLGKVYFNGNWYNESELSNPSSRLYAMLNSLKYYDKNKSGDQAGANSILTTYWGDLMVPSVNSETASYLGDFYQNPNYKYIPLNYNKHGVTYKGYNIPENYSIVKRMDLSENNMDAIGRRNESYIILDPHGNVINSLDGLGPIQDNLDYNDFVGLNETPTELKYINRASADKNDKYFYNRYLEDKGLIKAYVDPSNKDTVHVSVDESLGGDGKNVFLNMPRNVYETISNEEFLENLNNNPNIKRRFIDLIQGKFWKNDPLSIINRSFIGNNFGALNPENWIRLTSWELQKLGLKEEQASDIIDYFKKFYSSGYYTAKPSLKKGGILKGKTGIPKLPKLEDPVIEDIPIPEYDDPINLDATIPEIGLLGTFRQAKKSARKFARTNPEYDHFTWQRKQYGLNGKPYDPLYGSHPVDRKEFSTMPELINQGFSAVRLLNGFKTNADSADILKRGNREAAISQLKSLSPLRPTNTRLLAGNAEFQMANEIEQNKPPVTNDYNKYAAHDLNSKMQAAQLRGQGTRLRSEQSLADLKDVALALHEKAMRDWEITNQNRAIMGGLAASNANIDSATLNANNESWRQYLLEKQTEFDQNRGKMENAILAENRLNWQEEAEKGFKQDLQNEFGAVYNVATDKGNLTIEQWLSTHPEYTNKFNEIKKKWQRYVTDKELVFTKKQIPGKWMFKSGGSLRSTNDQIKINKHKAFDQNWVNNNKAVRRAIEKLNDRAYNILMKILSDEI